VVHLRLGVDRRREADEFYADRMPARATEDEHRPRRSFPGWLPRLLTHPVRRLESWRELLDTLTSARGAIKVYCVVSDQ
jgi:hypothetical protein